MNVAPYITPQSPNNFTALLRAEEVADILNIGKSTVYLRIKCGDIPSIRVGSSVRVLPEDLANYIQQNRMNNY
jgi:excisionase family DNA binding protein